MAGKTRSRSKAEESNHSILLVDKDPSELELLEQLITQKRKIHVSTSQVPGVALKMAQSKFYDIILINVAMNYNGTPYGGFELYKNLVSRYGDASVLLYSQYINEDLLCQYGYSFNFIEKGTNPLNFVDKVLNNCDALRRRQSCFVAMPFDPKFDAVYEVIRGCIERTLYRSVRVDRQTFTKSIIDKIFEEIRAAKLVVFLAADRNPNAF